MNRIVYLCLFIFFKSFLFSISLDGKDSIYIKYAAVPENIFIKEMQSKNYFCSGNGGGFLSDVRLISLTFHSREKLNFKEGRKEFIQSCQKLLELFNQDKFVRPYLNQYPFEMKNIELMLAFDAKAYENDQITLIFNIEERIYYEKFNILTGKEEEFYKETYEEALKALEQEGKGYL